MRDSELSSALTELAVLAPASMGRATLRKIQELPIRRWVSDARVLRSLALAVDPKGKPADPAEIWSALVTGDLSTLDLFFTVERWFALLGEVASAEEARPLSSRSRALLEPLLLGKSQKHAAIDRGVAQSTLSLQAHRALGEMGVARSPRRVPPMLALLASAAHGVDVPPTRVARLTHSSRSFLVVSVERPELQFSQRLPSAEYQVLCGVIEGASYAEIAGQRGTSMRTVANQVASVFHRLNVSGRRELVSSLLSQGSFRAPDVSGRNAEDPASEQVPICSELD